MGHVIYKGPHYTACEMTDGSLIVTSNKVQKGVRLIAESAAHWIDAIKTSIDKRETALLCKAVFQA